MAIPLLFKLFVWYSSIILKDLCWNIRLGYVSILTNDNLTAISTSLAKTRASHLTSRQQNWTATPQPCLREAAVVIPPQLSYHKTFFEVGWSFEKPFAEKKQKKTKKQQQQQQQQQEEQEQDTTAGIFFQNSKSQVPFQTLLLLFCARSSCTCRFLSGDTFLRRCQLFCKKNAGVDLGLMSMTRPAKFAWKIWFLKL